MCRYRIAVALLTATAAMSPAADPVRSPVGVVSHVRVVSDQVPDVSSIDAWKASFLKGGMSDRDKALAVWRTAAAFQHQDDPPREFLQNEETVQDPIKAFNVYGYGFCSMTACEVEALARAAGLRARGWGINGHSVAEIYYDDAWHMFDSSLVNYFPKADRSIASVEEVVAAVSAWHDKHPGYKGDNAKLGALQAADGWTGWKRGPELLARCPHYDATGWWPAKTHGWSNTMHEYDGTLGKQGKPFLYEYGYSQGYQVNVQLRPGERLTRNWSNKGLQVNGPGNEPGCLRQKTGVGALVYTPAFGDIAPARVGNGTLEYDVPLRGNGYRCAFLTAQNLKDDRAEVGDVSAPAALKLRMPSSYVYLSGSVELRCAVGAGGSVAVSFSDNNGLDWREIDRLTASGVKRIDLTPRVLRRYDYRLRFELRGGGTALDSLRLNHDIQHSQRPLPALARGNNTVTFSAGAAEGTVTVEGSTNPGADRKQVRYTDFHPRVEGFGKDLFIGETGSGSITFPVATPGDMVRLRFGLHYRARDARDGLDYQLSFDGGKTWKTVDRAAGPTAGDCKYVVCDAIPKGARAALVRFTGTSRNATGFFNFRIDADYAEPAGGFRPVRVTYRWDEDGKPCQDVHVARKPRESYTIVCAGKPVMKSIALELAE